MTDVGGEAGEATQEDRGPSWWDWVWNGLVPDLLRLRDGTFRTRASVPAEHPGDGPDLARGGPAARIHPVRLPVVARPRRTTHHQRWRSRLLLALGRPGCCLVPAGCA